MKAAARKPINADIVAPTVHAAARFKLCDKSHREIRYRGESCPVCERGDMVDRLQADNLRLRAENERFADVKAAVETLASSVQSGMSQLALKVQAGDEAIAMLIGEGERCGRPVTAGNFTGACIRPKDHPLGCVFSARRLT